MKDLMKIWACLFMCATLAACGGGGKVGVSGEADPLQSATFASQVPGGTATMQAAQVIVMGGFGLTADSKTVSVSPFSDLLYGLLGIKSATASNGALNHLVYALDKQGQLSSLNLIETINGLNGARSTVSLDLLSSGNQPLAPRLTGMLDTPKFILLAYKNLYKPNASGRVDRTDASTLCPILVLQKSDGKIYCLNLPPWCEDFSNCGNAHGNSSIQANATGDIIYMQDENWHLYKVNLTDPSKMVILKLTDRKTDGAIQSLIVNASGDAYVGISTGVDFQDLHRIYKAQGVAASDFQALPDPFLNCTLTGSAALKDEDNFYFTDESLVLKKLQKKADGAFASSVVYRNANWATNPLQATSGRNCVKTIQVGNYAFQMPTNTLPENPKPDFLTEILNPELALQTGTKAPRRISIQGVAKIRDVAACNQAFFVLASDAQGLDMLVKYAMANPLETSLSSGMQTVVLSGASQWSVEQFSVNASCDVEFTGLHAATGVRAIASISDKPQSPTVKKTVTSRISKIIALQ